MMVQNVCRRRYKGAIIESVIAFFFVVVALCLLLMSTISISRIRNENADISLVRQGVLAQIGEYFVRCVEEGEDFPKNCSDATRTKYSWIDEEAEQFFIKVGEEYGYTFTSSVWVDEEGFLKFYATKASYRKLVVKQGNNVQLTIVIRESKGKTVESLELNKASPVYEILDWSVNDININGSNEFTDTSTSEGLEWLKKIWKIIGEIIEKLNK